MLRRNGRLGTFKCDCGGEIEAWVTNVLCGRTRSCGCLRRENSRVVGLSNITHGEGARGRMSKEFRVWSHMIERCENPKNIAYARYGGRGICVCRRWRESFQDFLADMGRVPTGKTLDRIDNDGPYEPKNCRWSTPREQQQNTRSNRYTVVDGEVVCVAEAARRLGLRRGKVLSDLNRGLRPEVTK